MPRTAREFLDEVLATTAVLASEVRNIRRDSGAGQGTCFLRGDALFGDGSLLRFTIVASDVEGEVRVIKYAFHYADSMRKTLFRYDDTPGHTAAGGPYHKHVGAEETVVPSEPPSMETVLEEIRGYLTG